MWDEPVSLVGRLIFIAVSLIKIPQTELVKRICSCGVTNRRFWINEQQYELFSCTLKCHSDAFMAWDISNTDSYNNKNKIVFTLIKLFGKASSYLLPLFFTLFGREMQIKLHALHSSQASFQFIKGSFVLTG